MKMSLKIAAGIAAASLSLMACGGDDASTSTEAPADTEAGSEAPVVTETPAATEAPVTEAPAATEAPEAPAATEAPAAPEAPTTTSAPEATGPTFGAITLDCLNRGLRVSAEVNEGSSDISRVVVKRANDENAELETRLSFLGPDTGAGNVWNGVNVAGTVDRVTIVATDAAGRTASTQKSFNLPC